MVNKQQSLLNAGKSITERLWEEIDRIMDILMVEGEPDPDDYYVSVEDNDFAVGKYQEDMTLWGEHRGNAQGIAYAIAMMYAPYAPNVPHIKALAMERWQERNAE